MTNHTRRCVAFIAALTLLPTVATNLFADDVYTDPVGFITLTAAGTNSPPFAAPHASRIALGMTQLSVIRGNVTGISSNAIIVSTPLSPGQFNFTSDGHPTHFIEILNGANPGLLDDITGNSADTIYTASGNAVDIAGATNYKVYPHWTIGKVFGPTNEAGFLGGGTSGSADNINVWNPNTQGFVTYYFKTSGLGGTGWRAAGNTSLNTSNVVLYVDQGITILRRTSGSVSTKIVGGVKLGSTITPIITNGSTFVGNVYPAGITLGESGLYTTNSTTGLAGGGTSGLADNVNVWNPATQGYITYYYKTSGLGGTGWRATGNTSIDASTNAIPLGASVLIVRRSGNPSFNWSMPQPFDLE